MKMIERLRKNLPSAVFYTISVLGWSIVVNLAKLRNAGFDYFESTPEFAHVERISPGALYMPLYVLGLLVVGIALGLFRKTRKCALGIWYALLTMVVFYLLMCILYP